MLQGLAALQSIQGTPGLRSMGWMAEHTGQLGNIPITKVGPAPVSVVRALPQDIYDTEHTGTSALTTLGFFRNGQGQAFVNDSTIRKTFADTNMNSTSGQMPQGQAFDLQGFNVKIQSLVTGTEITSALWDQVFGYGSWFEFKISNKLFLQAPMVNLPTGMGKWSSGATGTGATAASTLLLLQNGPPSSHEFYPFTVNIKGQVYKAHLVPLEQFTVDINFGASNTFATNIAVKVILKGVWYNSI